MILGIYKFFYKMKFCRGMRLLAHAHNLNKNIATYALAIIQQMNSSNTGAEILVHIVAKTNGTKYSL